jgi:hypothetical protein
MLIHCVPGYRFIFLIAKNVVKNLNLWSLVVAATQRNRAKLTCYKMCARYAKKVQVSESGSVFNVGNRCKTYKYRTKKGNVTGCKN